MGDPGARVKSIKGRNWVAIGSRHLSDYIINMSDNR